MRSLNSVEVSPYSLTCALILTGESKSPLDGRPKVSAYFLLIRTTFQRQNFMRDSAPSKTILFQIVARYYTFLTW